MLTGRIAKAPLDYGFVLLRTRYEPPVGAYMTYGIFSGQATVAVDDIGRRWWNEDRAVDLTALGFMNDSVPIRVVH